MILRSLPWMVLLLLVLGVGVYSQAANPDKRSDIPGYSFEQLTDNDFKDNDQRVSSSGNVVWVAGYNLPGATGPEGDTEILFFDGNSTIQLTDDDWDEWRPVVSDLGGIAWQGPQNGIDSDIYFFDGATVTRITDDTGAETFDRYPDINNDGILVWGRWNVNHWEWASIDTINQATFTTHGTGYRPHINNSSEIVLQETIVDPNGNLVLQLPSANSLGYSAYRRREINDLGQLAIEADPVFPQQKDSEGPRDILFWDGSEMKRLYGSTEEWIGRADLNASGVIAWEGYGGLPGSQSGRDDREIFVYRADMDRIIQLTDDEDVDVWPTVSEDGRVFWSGLGAYPGYTSVRWDREIFIATPNGDADLDAIADADDNCPLRANVSQSDSGAVTTGIADGVGDACQCGDVTDDGVVDQADADAFQRSLAGISASGGLAPSKCRVTDGYEPCSLVDWIILSRAAQSASQGSTIHQRCDATLQF